MRVSLDEMIASLTESLTQMGEILDRLLAAAYTTNRTDRSVAVAQLRREIDQRMAAMESLIIDVLATQQPVLATDLSVVKGMLIASRQLGQIATEQKDLTHLTDELGITEVEQPPEVTTVLPEVRQVMTESVAAFLHDDRVLADFTLARLDRLQQVLQVVPTSPHPPTMVPVLQLHLFALRHVLQSAREIVRSAPLYRYVNTPS